MAVALARSWGLSPVVSSLQLDVATKKVAAKENTQIADLEVGESELHWTQTDNALPLPLSLDDGLIQFVLGVSELAAIDQQLLFVTGLPAARYTLKMDEKKIATFTREQLSSGVNLALYATPMESEAKGVDGIEQKRMRLDEARFLLVIEDPTVANAAEATSAIEAKDAALAAEQRKLAQPKPHRFELSPE